MKRRASLPGADELFRATLGRVASSDEDPPSPRSPASQSATGRASGRTSHDTKITVYLTHQELVELEQARLRLRAEFGLNVDRGRIVREAVAHVLAELRSHGPDAAILRNLT